MKNIDIKEIIMNALKEQREALLSDVCSVSINDADDYRNYVESEVFSENDILEKALKSIDLDVSDIDPNDFRDFQNETIELCLEKFKQQAIK